MPEQLLSDDALRAITDQPDAAILIRSLTPDERARYQQLETPGRRRAAVAPELFGGRPKQPSIHAPTGREPVMPADWAEDPIGSATRAAGKIAADLPALAASLIAGRVASWAAPKIVPALAAAKEAPRAIREKVSLDDVIGTISPRAANAKKTAESALEVTRRMRDAYRALQQADAKPAETPAPSHVESKPTDTIQASETRAPLQIVRRGAKPDPTLPPMSEATRLRMKLTPEEALVWDKHWREGMFHEDIWNIIRAERQLSQGLPTTETVIEEVAKKNARTTRAKGGTKDQ